MQEEVYREKKEAILKKYLDTGKKEGAKVDKNLIMRDKLMLWANKELGIPQVDICKVISAPKQTVSDAIQRGLGGRVGFDRP